MTRQDLEHVKWLNDRINQKLERIYFLKQRALPSAIRYKADNTSSTMAVDPIGDLLAEIDAEEREVTRLIDRYHRERTEAIRTIRRLESRRERNILYLRYIAFMSWNDVEKCVNIRDKCSRRMIFILHNQAIDKLK